MARSYKSDIDKVFRLITGSETTYVSPDFNVRLWDTHAPSVTVQTCTPEDTPQVHATVMSILGCDRHASPQPHLHLLPTHLDATSGSPQRSGRLQG